MSKVRTDWNLKLLYKGDNDPKLEADLKKIEKAYSDFERKYRGKDFTSSSSKLSQALKDRERLMELWEDKNPWWYFALRTSLDSNDNVAGAKSTQFDERLTKSFNKIKFFGLELAKIPASRHREYLRSDELKDYRHYLDRIFKSAKYRLSEGEEQLEDLLVLPGRSMWINGQSKELNQKTIRFKGREIPLPEAMSSLSDRSKKDRQALRNLINEVHKSMAGFAEAEINAVYTFKKIMDERRGFSKPYSATALSHKTSEELIENLASVVSKNFAISRRFYKLHARLLKEKKITYADRQVKIGKIEKKFTFNDSIKILKDSFGKFGSEYPAIVEDFLKRGQIDVYPKKGKAGGAFCWSMGAHIPTYILLNHVNNISSLETFAHEMGHAFHTRFSNTQPARYRGYSTASAEVASTFFEQMVVSDVEKFLSPKERIILLHNKILGDVSTIFRQIACFNFELELHNLVREKGQVPKGEMAELLAKHMRSYLGDAVEVSHDDGYGFVSWSHIRRGFYVYSYAFGQLVSRALFENWKKDPSYAEKVEAFLKAGDSATPQDIFKSIGIDVSDPKFFKLGLKSIEDDINRLEKLSASKI